MRAKLKEELVATAAREADPNLLEAEFVVLANDAFHKISDQVKDRVGNLNSDEIFFNWKEWLSQQLEKRKARKALEEAVRR